MARVKLQLKHLRHPVRSAAERRAMLDLLHRGEKRYANDPRFDLPSVTEGFAPHPSGPSIADAALDRICTAYLKASERESSAPPEYRASPWWEQIRRSSLAPVVRALRDRDLGALRNMYANFYRDACSIGLIGAPYGIARPYTDPKDPYRKLYLIDSLYRFDYWASQSQPGASLRELAGPGAGNPFGIVQDGVLIESGAEYRHYCASRVRALLKIEESPVVAEIGAGFGGMGYFLLRDRPDVTYVDFDVPESLALTAYFLMSAFPRLRFRLYGETVEHPNVSLLPPFELASTAEAADVTFSSHTIAQLTPRARTEYWKQIARITRRLFLYIGAEKGAAPFPALETRPSGWNDHKKTGALEIECLYEGLR